LGENKTFVSNLLSAAGPQAVNVETLPDMLGILVIHGHCSIERGGSKKLQMDFQLEVPVC
jgi:hypothetical protein